MSAISGSSSGSGSGGSGVTAAALRLYDVPITEAQNTVISFYKSLETSIQKKEQSSGRDPAYYIRVAFGKRLARDPEKRHDLGPYKDPCAALSDLKYAYLSLCRHKVVHISVPSIKFSVNMGKQDNEYTSIANEFETEGVTNFSKRQRVSEGDLPLMQSAASEIATLNKIIHAAPSIKFSVNMGKRDNEYTSIANEFETEGVTNFSKRQKASEDDHPLMQSAASEIATLNKIKRTASRNTIGPIYGLLNSQFEDMCKELHRLYRRDNTFKAKSADRNSLTKRRKSRDDNDANVNNKIPSLRKRVSGNNIKSTSISNKEVSIGRYFTFDLSPENGDIELTEFRKYNNIYTKLIHGSTCVDSVGVAGVELLLKYACASAPKLYPSRGNKRG